MSMAPQICVGSVDNRGQAPLHLKWGSWEKQRLSKDRRGVVVCGAVTRGRGARRRRPLFEETLGVSLLNATIYNPHPSHVMENGEPTGSEGQGG